MVISKRLHKGRFILISFQPFCPLLLCLSPFLWLCGVMGSPKCRPFPPIYEDGRIDTSRLPFISVKSVFLIISGETVVAVERIACVSVRFKPSWAGVCFKSFIVSIWSEHLAAHDVEGSAVEFVSVSHWPTNALKTRTLIPWYLWVPRRSSPVAVLFEFLFDSCCTNPSEKITLLLLSTAVWPSMKQKKKNESIIFFIWGKTSGDDFTGLTFQTVALFLLPSALTWTACALFPWWWVVCCVLFLFAPFWQTMRSPSPPLSLREGFQASPSSSLSSRDVRLRFFLLQDG